MWSHREQPGEPVSAFDAASGDYQFARRWFAGVASDVSDRGTDSSLTDREVGAAGPTGRASSARYAAMPPHPYAET